MLATTTKCTAVCGVALGRSCLFSLIFLQIKRSVNCCVRVNVFFVSGMRVISCQSVYDMDLPKTDPLPDSPDSI
jgi:hypothetical protein